jgi:hypothetical protein
MSRKARVRPSWKKPSRRKCKSFWERLDRSYEKFQTTAEKKLVGKLADEVRTEEDKRVLAELEKSLWERSQT